MNTQTESRILYSRARDGNVPVLVENGKYRILSRDEEYPTARQLLIALTGHPEARHWTFDRYFRQDKHSRFTLTVSDGISPIMDLFAVGQVSGLNPSSLSVSGANLFHIGSKPHSINPPTGTPEKPASNDSKGLYKRNPKYEVLPHRGINNTVGIDLARRSGEVKKLLFAGFGTEIYANGYDPDDVLQEVYKGLLVRNRGTCPWDPAKSSFGHYVHMVAGCIISNYHRKMNRQRAVEVSMGFSIDEDGALDMADTCAQMHVEGSSVSQSHDDILMGDFVEYLKEQAVTHSVNTDAAMQILPLVLKGYERGEIANSLKISKTTVSRALTFLRSCLGNWNLSPFMA